MLGMLLKRGDGDNIDPIQFIMLPFLLFGGSVVGTPQAMQDWEGTVLKRLCPPTPFKSLKLVQCSERNHKTGLSRSSLSRRTYIDQEPYEGVYLLTSDKSQRLQITVLPGAFPTKARLFSTTATMMRCSRYHTYHLSTISAKATATAIIIAAYSPLWRL